MKRAVYVALGSKQGESGLAILEMDGEKGAFRAVSTVEVSGCSYVCASRDGRRVYASYTNPKFGNGVKGRQGGLIFWEAQGTKLIPKSVVETHWATACHVSLAPDEKSLVWADYGNATAGFVDLDEAGCFIADSQKSVALQGTPGPNKPRQDAAHAHCAQVTPDGKYLCVVDLGLDEIKVYDFQNRAQALRELVDRTVHTKPIGAGPRHIVFHPNGKLAFVVFELDNYVESYHYADGHFTPIKVLSLVPGGFTGFSKAAAIRLAPDGKTLICTNRGHDSVAFVAYDETSGEMILTAIRPTGPDFPWDIACFPGACRYLLVAQERTNALKSFNWSTTDYSLVPVQESTGFTRPRGIAFGAILSDN